MTSTVDVKKQVRKEIKLNHLVDPRNAEPTFTPCREGCKIYEMLPLMHNGMQENPPSLECKPETIVGGAGNWQWPSEATTLMRNFVRNPSCSSADHVI